MEVFVCGVLAIIVGNGRNDSSSNLERSCLHFA